MVSGCFFTSFVVLFNTLLNVFAQIYLPYSRICKRNQWNIIKQAYQCFFSVSPAKPRFDMLIKKFEIFQLKVVIMSWSDSQFYRKKATA